MPIENISQISKNALCTACGACAGICPTKAVRMITNTAGFLVAFVDNDLCVSCRKCVKICPSNPENFFSVKIDDIFHGICLAGYVGYASDRKIRQKSQSGGIVTALLCYLLEKGEIDGAIVNNLNVKTRRPQSVFASSEDEIINGCGSYYAQSSVIQTILEHSDKNTAAVVLGCQAESLQFIKNEYKNINLPKYIIGLICIGQYSGDIIDALIEQSDCDIGKISGFRFRDKTIGGWPGDIHISTSNNGYSLPKERRLELKPIYELHRCIVCFDQMNVFSDIVCGDPWGVLHKQQPEGHTVVIARTVKGKRLLENAARDGAIILETLAIEDIFRGQTVDGRHKTKFYTSRDIFSENNWLFPYPEEPFENIKYSPAKKKEYQNLIEKLRYTRDLYLTTNRDEYLKKIQLKKKKIRKNPLLKMNRMIGHYAGLMIRKLYSLK